MQRIARSRPLRIPMRAFSRTEKVVAFCRVLLALATALIVLADPRLPGALPTVTAAVIGGYVFYSVVVFWLVRTERVRQEVSAPVTVAADVVWITVLTLLTERGASPFFLLHVFVILSVSVRWGFAATIRVCAILALLYPLTAFAASTLIPGGLFEFQRYHIFRPVYLLVLGYLIGYMGEHELQAKRKLGLMLELMTTVRRRRPNALLLGLLMRRVLRFFGAQHAVLFVQDPDTHRYFTWHLAQREGRYRLGLSITSEPTCEFPYATGFEGILANHTQRGAGTALCYDPITGSLERRPTTPAARLPIARPSGLIVSPIVLQEGSRGYAFVATTGRRRFTRDDLEYLLLLVTQGTAGLEAARLQSKAEEIAVLEERARIARDLHDGFIQSLAAIDLRLESLKRLLARQPDRVPAALDDLQSTVERGYADVRHYLKVLRDTTRPVEGLGTAVDRVVAEFTLRNKTSVSVHRPPTDPALVPTTVHELAQIIREALNNAARHGHAAHAIVKISSYERHLVLIVRDDGVGFATPADADGFLPEDALPWSIRERAELLGGELRIRSRPGKGTELSLSVPHGARPERPVEVGSASRGNR
jgi:signal transduction histidine kinase